MNRIYLFGKIIFKSKLKYVTKPTLKIYMEFYIETVSGNKFNCIVNEELADKLNEIELLSYIYVCGSGTIQDNLLCVTVKEIYKLQ